MVISLYSFYMDKSGTDRLIKDPGKAMFGDDWFTICGILA